MSKFVLKSNVLHSGQQFAVGDKCPHDLVEQFLKMGVLAEVPEAVKAPEPVEAPKVEAKKSKEK